MNDICCECSKIKECNPDLMQGSTMACPKYWPKWLSIKWMLITLIGRMKGLR